MNIRNLSIIAVLASASLVGCASTSPGYGSGYGGSYGSPQTSRCYDCGTVVAIERSAVDRGRNVVGPVLGGIVGAAAAREIAGRNTDSEGRRNTATAAGAIGGAVVGNAIQNRSRDDGYYNVHVRMQDGRTTVVRQDDLDGIREGSYVRIQNGRAYLY